jgi:hypothetical protein
LKDVANGKQVPTITPQPVAAPAVKPQEPRKQDLMTEVKAVPAEMRPAPDQVAKL